MFFRRNRKLMGWIHRVITVVKPEISTNRQIFVGIDKGRSALFFMENLAFAEKRCKNNTLTKYYIQNEEEKQDRALCVFLFTVGLMVQTLTILPSIDVNRKL